MANPKVSKVTKEIEETVLAFRYSLDISYMSIAEECAHAERILKHFKKYGIKGVWFVVKYGKSRRTGKVRKVPYIRVNHERGVSFLPLTNIPSEVAKAFMEFRILHHFYRWCREKELTKEEGG